MNSKTSINLYPHFFKETEKPFLEHNSLSASTFLYSSGVCGLKLKNQIGHIILLPFQGQQIWSVEFYNRNLTMKSMFTEPKPTNQYLHSYGGFLLHCGATAMGVPSENDTHPLHGELPNAPYQTAQLVLGNDEEGTYLGLTGSYQHIVAFNYNYIAQPLIKLYAHSGILTASMCIKNLMHTQMELMYMTHVNFRPILNGRLVYSTPCTPDRVRVRNNIPTHVQASDQTQLQSGGEYPAFLADLEKNPERHNILTPDLSFDPEVVFFIDYQPDEQGWAHAMQLHPNGVADFISHKPEQLVHGIRWITRTADQEGLGLNLPATAEPEGYLAEKAKGNIKILPGGAEFHCQLRFGALTTAQAQTLETKINHIIKNTN